MQAHALPVLRAVDPRHAVGLQLADLGRHDHAAAAAEHLDVLAAARAERVDHVLEVLEVAALVRADGDALRVLLQRGGDDLVHRAVVAEVDHLGPHVHEDAPHDVDGGVVAVEQRRGGDEADLVASGGTRRAPGALRTGGSWGSPGADSSAAARGAGDARTARRAWRILPPPGRAAVEFRGEPRVIEKDTVSMHFVRAAVAALSGEARARVLAASAIPAELLAVPHARVPAASFSALWLAVALELDDEFFGLDRRPMRCGSFALLCQAAVHGGDLEGALRRLLRGLALFQEDVRGELALEGRTRWSG